jgi:hypothetical protein
MIANKDRVGFFAFANSLGKNTRLASLFLDLCVLAAVCEVGIFMVQILSETRSCCCRGVEKTIPQGAAT